MNPSGTRVMRYESCIISHASPHRLALIIVVIAKHSFENRGRRKIIRRVHLAGKGLLDGLRSCFNSCLGLRAAAMACKSLPVSGGSSTTALAHGPIFGSSVLALANRLKIKTASQGTVSSGAPSEASGGAGSRDGWFPLCCDRGPGRPGRPARSRRARWGLRLRDGNAGGEVAEARARAGAWV
jgi:hypothetical protein